MICYNRRCETRIGIREQRWVHELRAYLYATSCYIYVTIVEWIKSNFHSSPYLIVKNYQLLETLEVTLENDVRQLYLMKMLSEPSFLMMLDREREWGRGFLDSSPFLHKIKRIKGESPPRTPPPPPQKNNLAARKILQFRILDEDIIFMVVCIFAFMSGWIIILLHSFDSRIGRICILHWWDHEKKWRTF